ARVRLGRLAVHPVRIELEHERRVAAALPDLGLLAGDLRVRPGRLLGARRLDEVRAAPGCAAVGLVPGFARTPAREGGLRRRLSGGNRGRFLDPAARAEPAAC